PAMARGASRPGRLRPARSRISSSGARSRSIRPLTPRASGASEPPRRPRILPAMTIPKAAAPVVAGFGAQSMTAPLRDVLVKRPGPAFGAAFDDPDHGFLHPVDLVRAQGEHDRFVELLASLGPTVHVLDAETDSPDLVYTFDPLLVGNRGAIP